MFKNLSHKKAFIALLFLFVGLFILNYIFVVRHVQNAKIHPNLPDSFPSDTSGPWQSYVWKDKLFGYPNDWIIEEDKNANGEVVSFSVFPKEKKHAEDIVRIGGGTCAALRAALCIGNEPVYTNSKDGSVLIVYNTIIKHITEVK